MKMMEIKAEHFLNLIAHNKRLNRRLRRGAYERRCLGCDCLFITLTYLSLVSDFGKMNFRGPVCKHLAEMKFVAAREDIQVHQPK
jgi:hypothetical protein